MGNHGNVMEYPWNIMEYERKTPSKLVDVHQETYNETYTFRADLGIIGDKSHRRCDMNTSRDVNPRGFHPWLYGKQCK